MAPHEARYRSAQQRLWESVGVTPTERWLDLRRTGTRVRLQEVGDGPPILFVHGASNDGTSWATLAAALPEFRCLLLDRPGCGLSPALAATFADVDRLAAFAGALLVDVFDALAIEHADVVSTSFGGFVALHSVVAQPDRFRRLVHLGWTVGAPIARTPLVMRLGSVPAIAGLMSRMPMNERAVRMMFKQIGLRQALEAGRISEEIVGSFLALMRDTPTLRNEVKAGPRLMTMRGLNDSILLSASLLGSITTPTYFLWGEEDPFGGAEVAEAFVAHIPGAMLELMPGAGHAVWLDDCAHTADTVRRFLSA